MADHRNDSLVDRLVIRLTPEPGEKPGEERRGEGKQKDIKEGREGERGGGEEEGRKEKGRKRRPEGRERRPARFRQACSQVVASSEAERRNKAKKTSWQDLKGIQAGYKEAPELKTDLQKDGRRRIYR